MLRRIGLTVLLGLIMLPAPETSHASTTTANGCTINEGFPSGINLEHTCAVLQAYIAAYNRHDVHAALALLDPKVKIADCDFVWNQVNVIVGKKEAAQWLRDRFAENDRFQGPIGVGGWTIDGASPLVFSFPGTRTNDALTARGAPPFDLSGSKGILNDAGTHIIGMTLGDFRACQQRALPVGPSAERTRTVLQVFIDAYNAHDVSRILQLFIKNPYYYDCDYGLRKYAWLYKKPDIRAWLLARFKQHDRVDHTQILLTSPSPRVALISYARSNDSLKARGLAPYTPPLLPKFVMNKQGDHIRAGGWDDCSSS